MLKVVVHFTNGKTITYRTDLTVEEESSRVASFMNPNCCDLDITVDGIFMLVNMNNVAYMEFREE